MNFVQMRDMQKCCEYACRAVVADRHMLKLATALLRPVVLAKIKSAGASYFRKLLDRNARFSALPKPLRGKALNKTASELGLMTRVKTVRVSVATKECKLARARKQMKMHDDIGRPCEREVVHKKKRNECIKKIVALAQQTGVADVTLIWMEFSACSKTLLAVALDAIAAVCSLTNVYVMDIHK